MIVVLLVIFEFLKIKIMKAKTKFEIFVVGIIIVAIGYIAFYSKPQQVEAQRTVVIDGNLYTASNLYSSGPITNTNDVRILYEEKNGMMLVGKGLEGYYPNTEDGGGTTLYLYTNDGQTKVSDKANVNYAIFDKEGENIIYHTFTDEIYLYSIKHDKNKRLVSEAYIPKLSPDGKSILFHKYILESQVGIIQHGFAILDLNSKKYKIIPNSQGNSEPSWTPDGEHVLFRNECFGMMNVDGTDIKKLLNPGDGVCVPVSDLPLLWSPDGKYALFQGNNDEIISFEFDIKGKKIITGGPIGYGTSPKWLEESKTISVLSPDAKVGDPALSVIDLNGKVLQGDKSHEKDYYSPSKGAFRRVAPKPVSPPLPPEPAREIPPGVFHLINTTQFPDVPKKIPNDALKPITQ